MAKKTIEEKRVYQEARYKRNKKNSVWLEKRRKQNREAKAEERADPIRGKKLRKEDVRRYKIRMENTPGYKQRKRNQANALTPGKRLRKYGVTQEWLVTKRRIQKNCCAICKQPETIIVNGNVCDLSIDHCHETGIVRELLCKRCNLGLGSFKDNPKLLTTAAAYIEKHQT